MSFDIASPQCSYIDPKQGQHQIASSLCRNSAGHASASLGVVRRSRVSNATGPRSGGPKRLQIRSGPTIKNTLTTAAATTATIAKMAEHYPHLVSAYFRDVVSWTRTPVGHSSLPSVHVIFGKDRRTGHRPMALCVSSMYFMQFAASPFSIAAFESGILTLQADATRPERQNGSV